MKIDSTDPNAKTLWVKAASGQVEDIVDIQSNAGVSYFKIDAAGNVSISGLGDVSGPASSTDNTITRFDGTSGKTIQGSLVTIDDNGKINIPSGQTYDINGTPHTHPGGAGDVTGPGSSTDNAFARFDSTTGKIIQNSLVTSDDNGSVNIPSGQFYKVNNTALAYGDVGAAASGHNHDANYISLISTPTAGNIPTITAGGELDNSAYSPSSFATSGHNHDAAYISLVSTPTNGNFPTLTAGGELANSAYSPSSFATSAQGVTNGNTHDHDGGDGGQIDHTKLSNIGTNTHGNIDSHISSASPHSGHAIGIASSTDNTIVRFDSTGGKQLQGSLVTIDDTGTVNIPSGQTYNINGSAHSHAYVAQALNSTNNTVSGRTSGEVVHMTGATTFDITKLAFSEMASGRIALTQMTAGTNGYFLKGTGATDPSYSAFALADIPSGTGVLKASGGAPSYQSLSSSDVGLGNVTNDAQVRKISSSTDNAVVRWDSTTGALVQDSVVTIADTTGAMSINGHQAITDPTGSPSGKFLRDDGVWTTPGGSGDVVGPGSATDNALPRFDTTTGKLLQSSVITVADTTGALSINAHQALTDPGASPSGKYLRDDGTWQTVSGSGDVVGPAGATNNAVARFDSATGKLLKNSLATIDDSGKVNIPTGQTYDINGSPHTHSLAAHALTSATHAESGLTSGHLLKATGTTTFGFSAGAASDVGLGNVTNNAQVKKIGSSTDNQVMRWDGATGDTPQGSLMTIDDSGTPNIPTGQTYNINGSAHTHSLAAHALTSATHAESGLTSGHLLKATGTTTFGFSAGAAGDVGLGNVTNNAQVKKIGSSTDNQVMRWDGTTGDTPQSCLMTVDDSGSPNIPTGQTYNINGSAHTHAYVAQALNSTNNTVSGRTSGEVVHMTGATTFDITKLQFSEMASGQASLSQMPRAASGFLKGLGAGADPGYTALALTDFPSGTGFLKGAGSTPSYTAFALTDIPSGTGVLKASSSTPTYQTLSASDVSLGNVTNNAQVKKIASSTDNAILRWDGTTGDLPQDSVVTIADTTGTIAINGHTAITDPTASPSGKFLRDDGSWQTATAGAHALDSTNNTVSGRTAGQVVHMTGATTFDITTLAFSELTAGQHTLAQEPRGTAGYYIRGAGASDPTYSALLIGDLPTITVAKGGLNLTSAATGTIPYASGTDTYSSLTGPTAQYKVLMASGSNAFSWTDLALLALPTVDPTKGGTGQTTCAKGDLFQGTGSNTCGKLTVGTNNYILVADSAQSTGAKWASDVVCIPFIIDGGGSAITTGVKGFIEVPFACTITGVTMLADQSGSIVVDIWKDTYANFPPVDADSITNATPPTISAATKSQDTTLSGWTTSVAAGDILAFNVDSATTVTRVTVSLKATKSR